MDHPNCHDDPIEASILRELMGRPFIVSLTHDVTCTIPFELLLTQYSFWDYCHLLLLCVIKAVLAGRPHYMTWVHRDRHIIGQYIIIYRY